MTVKLLPIMALAAFCLFGCAVEPEADLGASTGGTKSSEAPKTESETPKTETASKTEESKTDASGSEAKGEEKPVDPEAIAKEAKEQAAGQTAGGAPVPGKPKDGEEVAVIETSLGRIVLAFRPDKAPRHVKNFKDLANKKFYDGTRFHRCIEGFMIQGGDPNSKSLSQSSMWGTGGNVVNGQEQMVDLETSDLKHTRGVLSMARSSDPNSASSQFFIMHKDSPSLDGQYSAFGKAISGMDVVDKIVKTGDPANNGSVEPEKAIIVKSIRIVKWPVK